MKDFFNDDQLSWLQLHWRRRLEPLLLKTARQVACHRAFNVQMG